MHMFFLPLSGMACSNVLLSYTALAFLVGLTEPKVQQVSERWPAERARQWGDAQPWRLGANYLPSHCGNVMEMFGAAAFDATLLVVERELRVAQVVGFSAMRVFLHEELYFRRGAAFLEDVSRLLALLHRHGMSAMLVLFDACWRPDLEKAERIPGVHNSAWVQCPTHTLLRAFANGDVAARERLREYVCAVVGRFANDPRVAVWDVYNEPSMRDSEHWIFPRLARLEGWSSHPSHWLLDGQKFVATLRLLRDTIAWARSMGPSQPLTTAVWDFPSSDDDDDVSRFKRDLNIELIRMIDVVSLHCYCEPDVLDARLVELAALQRGPVLVTEFMARPMNSTLANSLPVLRRYGAWGYTWGLFRGKSQTHRSWDTWIREDIAEDTEWFHDVFYDNATPYDPEEVKQIWWHAVGSHLET